MDTEKLKLIIDCLSEQRQQLLIDVLTQLLLDEIKEREQSPYQ